MSIFLPFINVAQAVTISMGIPGTNPNTTSTPPGAVIANFYQFALMIGGVLAFGIVVYGGVRYMTSAGNPSGQSDAKEWIEAALIGLLLLIGAYFILNVVNPQLTNLNMPALQTVNITPAAVGCGTTSCQSGFVPTPVTTAGGSTSCACQNATGAQGCGGGVMGTAAGSCPSGQSCVETNTNPVTYGCQATATFDCGTPQTHYGKCASPEYCKNYTSNSAGQPLYECALN